MLKRVRAARCVVVWTAEKEKEDVQRPVLQINDFIAALPVRLRLHRPGDLIVELLELSRSLRQ
jgi:hypothetical protein